MNKIKSILLVLFSIISLSIYATDDVKPEYKVRSLQLLSGDSILENYLLPSDVKSITFSKVPYYSVSIESANLPMGTNVVITPEKVLSGQTAELYAEETAVYKFSHWSVNGVKVSEENPYTITVEENVVYKPNFVEDLYASRENEAIDLDLPSGTKWASCNLGASSPLEYGASFLWGETEVKDYIDVSTYTFECNEEVLPLEADAAHVILGGAWRMPTAEDCQELIANVTITPGSVKQGGKTIRYLDLISKNNGASIKIPIVPVKTGGSYFNESTTTVAWYWTSSNITNNTNVRSMYCNWDYEGTMTIYNGHTQTWGGLPIRPVIKTEK